MLRAYPFLASFLAVCISGAHADTAASHARERIRAAAMMPPSEVPGLVEAAVRGDGRAMAVLGEAYAWGFAGLRQDRALAIEWLRKADASGVEGAAREADFFRFSMTNAARLDRGLDAIAGASSNVPTTPRSDGESDSAPVDMPTEDASEIQAFADLGSSEALFAVGRMRETGRGLPKDEAEAFRSYSLAAAKGNVAAHRALKEMHAQGRGTPVDPTASDAERLAAAEGGDVDCQMEQAFAMGTGLRMPVDRVGSLTWFMRAATAGSPDAERIATYLMDIYAPQDVAAATRAAEPYGRRR